MIITLKKWALLVVLLPAIFSCASTPSDDGSKAASISNVSVSYKDKNYKDRNKDPFEGINRVFYSFNNGIDTYFLKPLAQGYRFVTPDMLEVGVSNFFSNLLEIRNVVNSSLQIKGDKALHHTGRFIINSTFGLFGLLDLAQQMGLEKTDGEDFGQTLGRWGVGSGPYIVLPFLGPSTFRDTASIPIDTYTDPVAYVGHFESRLSLSTGRLIDTRANLLDTEKLLSGDRYIFIRDAYLQRRHFLVKDGRIEDDFGESTDEDF